MAMDGGVVVAGGMAPGSVRGARALLTVQGVIWGLAFLGTFFFTSPSLAGQYGAVQKGITVLALAVLGRFAGGSLHLAARLARPGQRRARVAAIGLEGFMTLFGLVIGGLAAAGVGLARTGGGPAVPLVLAGLIGAALSGAAVTGMLGAGARRYCAGDLAPAAGDG